MGSFQRSVNITLELLQQRTDKLEKSQESSKGSRGSSRNQRGHLRQESGDSNSDDEFEPRQRRVRRDTRHVGDVFEGIKMKIPNSKEDQILRHI